MFIESETDIIMIGSLDTYLICTRRGDVCFESKSASWLPIERGHPQNQSCPSVSRSRECCEPPATYINLTPSIWFPTSSSNV